MLKAMDPIVGRVFVARGSQWSSFGGGVPLLK